MLPNLTHLSLAHNQLYALPAALLASFPALATLDITGNQLIHYYPVFTPNIKVTPADINMSTNFSEHNIWKILVCKNNHQTGDLVGKDS